MIVINEQELLDMIISERIQMLLKPMNSTNADEKKHILQLIDQAEVILKHLPDSDRNTLNQYLCYLMEQMAEEEPCLYTGGFKDGIRVMKFIGNL